MDKFTVHSGVIAPIDKRNIDTDQIIPKQFLKSIKRTGFGDFLFDNWRFTDEGNLHLRPEQRHKNPEFILNNPAYSNATILLAKENFGCGSSREHALWALVDYGFRVVLAPSFADIFYSNSFKNGLLPIVISNKICDQLMDSSRRCAQHTLYVDLPEQTCMFEQSTIQQQLKFSFSIDPALKYRLIHGLDDIDATLEHSAKIHAYEDQRRTVTPWLFIE